METRELSNTPSVKVDCSFCGKGIECPEDMLKTSKKHMCYECFITYEPSDEEIKDVNVDIPTAKLPEVIASSAADKMILENFPNVWSAKKEELKEMSKKDLAAEMFGAGVYLGLKGFLETMKEAEEKLDKLDNEKNNQSA